MRPRFDTFVEKGEVLSHSAYKHPAVMSLIVPWRSHFEKALLGPRKYTHILQLIGKLRQAVFPDQASVLFVAELAACT